MKQTLVSTWCTEKLDNVLSVQWDYYQQKPFKQRTILFYYFCLE